MYIYIDASLNEIVVLIVVIVQQQRDTPDKTLKILYPESDTKHQRSCLRISKGLACLLVTSFKQVLEFQASTSRSHTVKVVCLLKL